MLTHYAYQIKGINQHEKSNYVYILYVHGAYRGPTPIGKLMHDFSCTNSADMNYDVLAERVKYFKESKEGVATMCKVMEDMREQSMKEGLAQGMRQGMKQGMKDTALRMLQAGKYALDEIAAISGLSVEEVRKLSEVQTA